MARPIMQDTTTSLGRGLRLLDLFTENDAELSVGELARRSGVPKSTTHRLVGDLVQWGALERGVNGVRLGVRLFELGQLVPAQRRLRDLAIPYAHNLNELTKLTCNLAIRDGQEIVYIEKIRSRTLRVPHSRAGGRLPLSCTALGKAILAFSEPEFVESVLSGRLVVRTPKSITDPEVLRRELADIRRARVAYDSEESYDGLFCVAAPIFSAPHQLAGAISVTGATKKSEAQRFGPAVQATAMALSRVLSGHLPRT